MFFPPPSWFFSPSGVFFLPKLLLNIDIEFFVFSLFVHAAEFALVNRIRHLPISHHVFLILKIPRFFPFRPL